MSRSWTHCRAFGAASIAVFGLALLGSGCGGSDGGDDSKPALPNVVLFASAEDVTDVTGQGLVAPKFLFPYIGRRQLIFDLASRSILLLESDGRVSLFTSKKDLTDATGESTVSLGPMDLILEGLLQDVVFCADDVTGLLLRIEPNGDPAVHSTVSQITQVTGAASAQMARPRRNLQSQIIAQDLITREILLFGTSGVPQFFVRANALASVAEIAEADAIVAGWVRGGATGSHYAWFNATNSILRIQANGTTTKWIDGKNIEDLFRGIATPRILKIAVPSSSDELWVLVGTFTGNVPRGLGVAVVPISGPAQLFTSEQDFTNLLGQGYNISDFGFVPTSSGSAFYGVDRATAQALTFDARNGLPSIIGTRENVESATGVTSPLFGPSGPIRDLGIVIFDSNSQGHILVQ